MGVQYTRILRTYSGEVYDFSAEHDSYVQALASLAYTTDTRSRNNEFNIGQHADKITYLYEHAYMTYNFLGFRYIPDYNSFSEGDKSFSFNSENTYGVNSHAEGAETYSLGQYTHAEGYKTVAYAKYGHTEGNNTVVVGIGNHAEGNLTYVDGEYSHAEGVNNMSYDSYTHIEGHSNISYARTTHIEGYSNIAYSGYISHIEGFENNTYSSYAHTEGRANITYGNVSHVEGKENINFGHITHVEGHANVAIRDYAHVEGHHSYAYSDTGHNEGWYTYTGVAVDEIEKMSTNELPLKYNQVTHAEGIHTYAVASGSHSEGIETLASGLGSHAEGRDTKAIGYYSHAEGSYNVAYNDYSHAEGVNSYAAGEGSHAEGYSTAYGEYAHSEGDHTIANHDYTHTEGQYSQANGLASHAEGNSIANGEYSHSEGKGTTSNETASHAEGINTNALKQGSHSEGVSTYVYGIGGHAEGYYTYATASYTHAEGCSTKASSLAAHAEGYKSNATNTYSHAEGSYTTASGISSHAEGSNTIVKTSYGHAEGYYTYVSGDSAHAEGVRTYSKANGSHSEGVNTFALDTGSHAEGFGTNALGYASHAEGIENLAKGLGSHTEGRGTHAEGDYSHAEGNKTYTSQYAHAEGVGSHANGIGSHAEGYETVANTSYSHTEGFKTETAGDYSHAEGIETLAYGLGSHVEGANTIGVASYTHAEGTYTTAYAVASHAEGQNSYAKGVASHAEGIGTYAYADGSHVVGKYNIPNNNAISIIGIGSGDNDRKNAVEILTNGNAYFMNVGGFNGTNINEATPLNKVIDNINTNIDGLVTAYNCMPKDFPWVPKDELNASYVGYISVSTAGNENVTYFGLPFIYNYSYDSIAEGFGQQGPGLEGLNVLTYGVNHAYGVRSHAEGIATNTYNRGEHAEGIRNFSTPGVTLHSVGFGDRNTCKNAIEITRTGYTYLYGIGEYYGYMNNDAEFVPKSLQEYLKESDEATTDALNDLASRIPSIEYTPYITAQYGKKIGTLTVIKGVGEHSEPISYTIYGPKDTAGHIYNEKTDSLAEGSNIISYAPNTAGGSRSHAEGVGTNALGYASHAEGNFTYVYNDYGHAEGNKCIVNGNSGHAEGGNTIAGKHSHAEGDCTHAINTSHAEGVDTFAGNISHAEGDATFATGRFSHAEGVFCSATGNYSHAEGEGNIFDVFTDSTDSTWFYFSSYEFDTPDNYNYSRILLTLPAAPSVTPTQTLLNKTTVVYFTDTTGGNTYVVPVNLSVLPTFSTSNNKFTVALPIGFAYNQNIISGMVRFKFVYLSTTAAGRGSHVEGCDTNAQGQYSHAEGWHTKTTTTGTGAHAEGIYTEASGNASHASGYGTVANLAYMTAIGYYNKEQSGAYKPALFDVGFGTSTARNSIFTIFADDKTPGADRIANVQIKGDLLATGKLDVTGNVSGANLPIVKRYDLVPSTGALHDRLKIDGKNANHSICKIYVYNALGSSVNIKTEIEAALSANNITINGARPAGIVYSSTTSASDWNLPNLCMIEFEITLMIVRMNNLRPLAFATLIGKWPLTA